MNGAYAPYLQPTWFIDSDAPRIVEVAHDATRGARDDVESACRLYYAVRDGIRYTAYNLDLSREALRATSVLDSGIGWCVSKSILLAALCRATGIACRLGYANVRNHMATAKLLSYLGTDVFYYHGYNEIYLNGRWVKATSTFNRTLCEKARIAPLEFDGVHDSLYHPFDLVGARYMEYLHDHGTYADLPYDDLTTCFKTVYPRIGRQQRAGVEGDFMADIAAEAAAQPRQADQAAPDRQDAAPRTPR